MRIGVFAKIFARPAVEAVFDAVRAHGLDCVQFNMACAGLPPLPERIDPALCDRVRGAAAARGVALAAVSGTCNLIHPDPARRREGLRRLRALTAACPRMGVPVVTLCTGTRDPDDPWRAHPDNASPGTWSDLLASVGEAVRAAEDHGVTLAFEPEVSNVVDSAPKARRLLDAVGSPRLKVLLDGANLIVPGNVGRMREVLDEAFALLGPDIALAHAKDVAPDGRGRDLPAGRGALDYDRYLAGLRGAGCGGPVVLHGLDESQVDAAAAFVRGRLAAAEARPGPAPRES